MPQNDQKQHFIERIFGAFSESARKDIKSFFIVILIGSNAFFISKWTSCTETRVVDKQSQYNEILRLVLPRIEESVERKVEQKTRDVSQKVEKVDQSLGELTKAVKESVEQITK